MVPIISAGPFPLSDLIAHSAFYIHIYKIMLRGLIHLQHNVIAIHYLCNMDTLSHVSSKSFQKCYYYEWDLELWIMDDRSWFKFNLWIYSIACLCWNDHMTERKNSCLGKLACRSVVCMLLYKHESNIKQAWIGFLWEGTHSILHSRLWVLMSADFKACYLQVSALD